MREFTWHSRHLDKNPSKGILFLPGRGEVGEYMMQDYEQVFDFGTAGIALMSLTPFPLSRGWYPMPFGPHDQRHAVKGLHATVGKIEKVLDGISHTYGIDRKDVLLCGFSAGAVVAINFLAHTKKPPLAVVSHSGAVLEPESLPACRHPNTPVILNHAFDDYCFDWFERYLPMKTALKQKGYRVGVVERHGGNHSLLQWDVKQIRSALEKLFRTPLSPVTA